MPKPKEKKSMKQRLIDQAIRRIENRKRKLKNFQQEFDQRKQELQDEIAEQEELLAALTQ